MLRSFFIYMSKAEWARKIITNWKFAWKAASRFVAGEKLEDAILAVQLLNQKGILATLDHLGEHTLSREDASRATQAIIEIGSAIRESGIKANISVKLTQIGLALSPDIASENLALILETVRKDGIFVRVDMEDSTCTEITLDIVRRMRQEKGLVNVGVVIQSYLYRSEADIANLMADGTPVRLCKGAYKEPADVAFPKKSDVDSNYDKLTRALIDGAIAAGSPTISSDGRTPPIPAIASHDPARLAFAKKYAASIGFPKQALEFQMLHGIRRDLQEQSAKEGYPVRVYVPYGTEWYPYYVRRLAERPANVWFFISNFFRK